MLCQECTKKPTCKKLCKKAEKYVSQDNVGRRERLLRDLREPSTTDLEKGPKISTTEACLQLFFLDRLSVKEIAKKLYVSDKYVYKVIARAKIKIAAAIKKSG